MSSRQRELISLIAKANGQSYWWTRWLAYQRAWERIHEILANEPLEDYIEREGGEGYPLSFLDKATIAMAMEAGVLT